MPSTYDLKQRFSGLLRPVAAWLVRCGATANQVTVSAMVLSGLAGGAMALWPQTRLVLILLPVVLLVRMALNNIDGVMAREFGQQSALGGYLNELGDLVSDAALYLPFALVSGFSPWLVVLFVVTGLVAEFAGVLAHAQGRPRGYQGPLTKSDRALVMSLLALAAFAGWHQPLIMDGALALASALTLVTIVNRVRHGIRSDHA